MKGLRSARRAPSSAETTKRNLVRILLRPIQEGGTIDVITGRVVKAARIALAGHLVAHDVLEMRPCRAEVAGSEARVAGLDDHTAAARSDEPCGRAHAGTHSTLGRCRRDVASLPQRTGTMLSGLPEHDSGMALSPGASRIPYASELGIKLVLGHQRTSKDPRDGETRWRCALRIQDGVKDHADVK